LSCISRSNTWSVERLVAGALLYGFVLHGRPVARASSLPYPLSDGRPQGENDISLQRRSHRVDDGNGCDAIRNLPAAVPSYAMMVGICKLARDHTAPFTRSGPPDFGP